MGMKRFMVVRHTQGTVLSVHRLLHEYHGEFIAADFAIVLAGIPQRSHDILMVHPNVLLMPSLASATTVYAHAQKKDRMEHFLSLKAIGLDETHRTADLAQLAVEKFGVKFQLDY